jgi:hypothetical protein
MTSISIIKTCKPGKFGAFCITEAKKSGIKEKKCRNVSTSGFALKEQVGEWK